MNKKLLVVFNTCGIKGDDKTRLPNYLKSLESIRTQQFDSFDLVVSACQNSPYVVDELRKHGYQVILYKDVYPVNVTFNKTVMELVKQNGIYGGYVFVDSGIRFTVGNVLERMWQVFQSDEASMVSVATDTDSGKEYWFPYTDASSNEIFRVPLDGALNLHCQLFSEEHRLKYDGKIIPDIFLAYCTESQFVSMCSAIKRKWLHINSITLEHNRGMDAPSSLTPKGHDAVYLLPKNMFQIMLDPDHINCGGSYEAYRHILKADRSKFDSNMYSIDDKLYNWLKTNIFLDKEYLNYDNIKVC